MKSPVEAVAEPHNPTANVDGAFVVELDRFQGPLDLLLHLIREQDIDIFDIPIGQITEQFLRAMSDVERLGLDRAGEFLEMAATLVRIKAQMLMPRRTDALGELEDPRAELVRRLLEYEHFREASLRLAEAQADRGRHYARGHVPPRTTSQPVVAELECTWDEVFAAALRVGERPKGPDDHVVAQRAVPIEEKIGLIVQTLAQLARVEFRRLVEPFGDKLHGVVTFMAGLELSKRRQLSMRQSEPFADIWLYRRDDVDPDEADVDGTGMDEADTEDADAPDADH
ncbi:MAG TPA: segregation/condensation protein A [Longimicrobiales bacterium]|nr:segregation/condensation protein A [Longimicrobiales bacterium]